MSAYHQLLACPLVLQIDDVICEQPLRRFHITYRHLKFKLKLGHLSLVSANILIIDVLYEN